MLRIFEKQQKMGMTERILILKTAKPEELSSIDCTT